MTDQVFGELDFDGFYWNGHINLDFFGEERQLNLIVDSSFGEQTEVSELQHEAYHSFLEKWPGLQEAVMQKVIRYYNEEERFAYGPDDPKEFAAWWPEIETVEEMCKWVTLETALCGTFTMENAVSTYCSAETGPRTRIITEWVFSF